jgi:hypothetical protein
MFAQGSKLIELLDHHGWELVQSYAPADHWVIEQWLVKSTWSPTDCYVFLTFEIDPQMTRRETSKIYSMTASLNKPLHCYVNVPPEFEKEIESEHSASARVGRHWEKDLPGFFDELANLRTKFDNLKR